MGSKKKKLLAKYLEKKKRQKDRDSLYERLRELQAKQPLTAASISTLKRISSSKRTPSARAPTVSTKTKAESEKSDKVQVPEENPSRPRPFSSTKDPGLQPAPADDGILLFPVESRCLAGRKDSQVKEEEKTAEKPEKEKEEKAARIKTPKAHSKTRARQCNLPITYLEDEIVAAVKENPVVLVSGGPGTGKSTQVPQFLYENGMCHEKKLCLTQPRRVSAKAIADRVSEEQEKEPGEVAGYRIRYESNVKDTTSIYVQTEGVLLQELADDPWLSAYSVVILDEVHERSVTSDTLLVILLGLASRTGLRLVLMSAGITQAYAEAVQNLAGGNVPIIQVPSQRHEVQIHYLRPRAYNYLAEVAERVERIEREEMEEKENEPKREKESTSILVFLATKEETENMKLTLSPITSRCIRVLHSDTPSSQQKEILRGTHLLILATNIAETSLTLPDVKYVVDGGREVRREYNSLLGAYSYSTVIISKGSAEQRSGRTGRTGPGICYRVYTVAEYERMQDSRPPEILRDNVLFCIIPLLKAGVRPSNISRMAYITPPPAAAITRELERLVRAVVEPRHLENLKGAVKGIGDQEHLKCASPDTASGLEGKGSRLSLFDSMYATGVLNPAWAFPIHPVLSSILARALKRSSSTAAIDMLVEICATVEVCSTKKSRGTHTPEPIEIQDKAGNRKYAYVEALSVARTLPHQARQRVEKIKKLLNERMKKNGIEKKEAREETSADIVRDTAIPLLAYAMRDNMVTVHKRRYYHGGEEVIVQSPIPEMNSESPVPILYHSLATLSTSPIRKVYLHSVVIPSFTMP